MSASMATQKGESATKLQFSLIGRGAGKGPLSIVRLSPTYLQLWEWSEMSVDFFSN